eukprot:CAMPEP_0169067746 /NCGR_PEP_ID=MMETSP1015-20121227/3655_1 /TAXON_ID=342587 /ORGANISM="Karlodinium micrum, Strain CCMP2283" /LENGTH=34 /DNA_ID= /DNA_START= /DNA_END= /DNA_ORIENTATION=
MAILTINWKSSVTASPPTRDFAQATPHFGNVSTL